MNMLAACKKKDDTSPAPVQMKCVIVNPLNDAEIQVGAVVNVEAEISGFGSGAIVVFTIDSHHIIEVSGSPYIFLWDTKYWLPDTIRIRAEAYKGAKLVSDTITVFLIDTIFPMIVSGRNSKDTSIASMRLGTRVFLYCNGGGSTILGLFTR